MEKVLIVFTSPPLLYFHMRAPQSLKEKKGVFEQVNVSLKYVVFINGFSSNVFTEKTINYFHQARFHIPFCYYIEDITRWREDMNFIFEWQNNILRTSAASE